MKTPHDDWPWWLTVLLFPLAVAYVVVVVAASLGFVIKNIWTGK